MWVRTAVHISRWTRCCASKKDFPTTVTFGNPLLYQVFVTNRAKGYPAVVTDTIPRHRYVAVQ